MNAGFHGFEPQRAVPALLFAATAVVSRLSAIVWSADSRQIGLKSVRKVPTEFATSFEIASTGSTAHFFCCGGPGRRRLRVLICNRLPRQAFRNRRNLPTVSGEVPHYPLRGGWLVIHQR